MNKFTFIDLFSGIGGFRIALENLGGTCLGFSEINKSAISTYKNNFGECHNFGDITKLSKLPQVDILTAGVPCQAWSIAGKNLGFDDPRGKLWEDTLRVLAETRPKAFVFENVKGLTDPRNEESFCLILKEINKIGYHTIWNVLKSSDYGLKQDRGRLYIIGFLDKKCKDSFKLEPKILNDSISDYYILSDVRSGIKTIHSWDLIETTTKQKSVCELVLKNRRKKIYGLKDGNPLSLDDLKTLDSSIASIDLEELVSLKILRKVGSKYEMVNSKISTGINGVYRIFCNTNRFPTLVSSDTNDYISTTDITSKEDVIEAIKSGSYRKLTKEECLELQGFPVDYNLPESRQAWMKLVGNSVSAPVIEMLGRCILATGCFE